MKFICWQLTLLQFNDLFNKSIYEFIGKYKIEYNSAKTLKKDCLNITQINKGKK